MAFWIYSPQHTHMLRQPLSEWQVMGQVLSRHIGGGGSRKREGPCGEL